MMVLHMKKQSMLLAKFRPIHVIIVTIAERNNVQESCIRAEMEKAIRASRNSSDILIKAQWADSRFEGSELTVEEFIVWLAKKVYARRNSLE